MNTSRARQLAIRALAVGGVGTAAAVGGAYAFPKYEDRYWRKKDPDRVTRGQSKGTLDKTSDKKRLVILGTGWAGVSTLKHIDRDKYEVIIISPRNFFLFTPLLPSVCVGTITQDAVTVPIRDFTTYKSLPVWDRIKFMWRGYLPARCRYLYAAATDIDREKGVVTCRHQSEELEKTFEVPYDQLVVATGATTNTFNTRGVDEYCHYLKQTGDAAVIRNAVLENLEKASLPTTTNEEKEKLLSFIVVGGGPTGLEFAAELQDFLESDVVNPVKSVYHNCAGHTSVTLVQSNKHLLPGYPEPIQLFSENHMEKSGINLLMNTRVMHITKDTVGVLDKATKTKKELPYGLVVWATGVSPGKLAKSLINQLPEQMSYRALKVDSHCKVIGTDNIWAIGDAGDIDVLPEYKASALKLFRSLAGKEKQLTLEGETRFVKELQQHFQDTLHDDSGLNVQQKIVEEFSSMLKRADDEAHMKKKGVFKGLTEEDVGKVIEGKLARQLHLPPTAQVAHQQGEYLAHILNHPKVESDGHWTYSHNDAFSFTNFGKLVYVGGHMAAVAVPKSDDVEVSWNGSLTNYFWHAAYFGMLESSSARHALFFNWVKGWLFGRSTALDAICTDDAASEATSSVKQKGTSGGKTSWLGSK